MNFGRLAARRVKWRALAHRVNSPGYHPFRQIFDDGLSGKILANSAGMITRANDSMADLLGATTDELYGRSLVSCFENAYDRRHISEEVVANGREFRGEMALLGTYDREIWALVSMTWTSRQAGRQVLLVQVEDHTARRVAEARLTSLALHDALTGLPNRRLLLERCERAFTVARTGRSGTSVAALFIDLDGFKSVNDRAGHDVGDQLLAAIAHDVLSIVRPSDTVARIGGDEFVVLVERDDGVESLHRLAERVIDVIRRQVVADGVMLKVSASIGVAVVDLAEEPTVHPDQLIIRADAAMYRAKQNGKDTHYIFDIGLSEVVEARIALELEMRRGLAENRISLVFQPVIDVDSSTVVGAEALVRLHDAEGRLLPTLQSVIAAESAGLAEELTDRVLDLALDAIRGWPPSMTVAVNVSARELSGRSLGRRVGESLERHAIDHRRLILEVTETSVVDAGPAALKELQDLRAKGVRVSIDDFGTAYATLHNLTTLPVDILKVDASFTAGLPDSRTHSAVVHGIAAMAAELGIPCVVEGVETDAQRSALRGMGVLAQGWWWGLPRDAEHVPGLTALRQNP